MQSTLSTASASPKRLLASGLSLEVPEAWKQTSVPEEPCLDLIAPGAIVGTFVDVRNCFMQTSTGGPAVTFASGGPPSPPVPTGRPESRTVNGVATLVSTADFYDGRTSEYLALFPEWDSWLRVQVSGGRAVALEAGDALLNTIAVTGAESPPHRPRDGSFDGDWYVHGAQLRIDQPTALVTSSCGAQCLVTEHRTLSLSADGKRLDAVITNITYTDLSTGQSVPNPNQFPGDSAAVGASSYLEFVAPHLLKETFIHSSVSTSRDYGNPYWCGDDLDPLLRYDCGA